jgi:hydroxymethylbilane synthase
MRKITVGTRNSPLALVQVDEVLQEIKKFDPSVFFEIVSMKSTGDHDLKTSLKTLDRTDFFTKEIDQSLIDHQVRIGIHSAKDLPEPLREGLTVVAITRGVDPSDSLILHSGETLMTLPIGAKVGTSSQRREDNIRQIRPDLDFIDVRGNIQQRLQLLDEGVIDALVIAEAALIRLGLTHLHREPLGGEVAQYQGQLAVVARSDDQEMADLFSLIDVRCPC